MKPRRVDFYPDEWLSGTGSLDAVECGIYITACSLIYSHGGPIPKEELRLRVRCHGNAFNRALSRLIRLGKLVESGEEIANKRCANELEKARKRIETAKENVGKSNGRPRLVSGLENPAALIPDELTTNHQPPTTTSAYEANASTAEVCPPNGGLVDAGQVADEMFAIWREVCGHIHNPIKLDKDRAAKMRARLKDAFDKEVANWRACCERVAASPLLSGQKAGWHANLDWVLDPRHLRKILEGQYDDGPVSPPPMPPDDPLDLWRGRLNYQRSHEGRWLEEIWGPAPGTADCQAPEELLAEYGFGKAA